MQRVGRLLLTRGLRVVRMDLRGCGSGLAVARRPYHGGCSDDVRAAVEEIRRWSPSSPVTLTGFSLGGNIVLKLAGESAGHPVEGLERVAALAHPLTSSAVPRSWLPQETEFTSSISFAA